MSKNTAYEQKDLNMVISEPIRNPWIEMGLKAKAYFEAYRGQCRLRISYARRSRALLAADYISNHIDKGAGLTHTLKGVGLRPPLCQEDP